MTLTPSFPGVFIEETPSGVRTITGVATSVAAFIGRAGAGPVDDPAIINSFADFEHQFGGLNIAFPMSYAVQQFYQNGGSAAVIVRLYKRDCTDENAPLDEATFKGDAAGKTGLYALDKTEHFNLLCIPPDTCDGDVPVAVYQAALAYCVTRRAMLIVDPPAEWKKAGDIAADNHKKVTDLGLDGEAARNAALFFPRIVAQDSPGGTQTDVFVPCGAVAGVMARSDGQRGVWVAPAGINATITGIAGLSVPLTDDENGLLNTLGVNGLRSFPTIGPVVWGSRTLRGADLMSDEYKYIPVRRLALFIEESLYRGLRWAAFEPNDEALWAQISLTVDAFMRGLFRQGAFQGETPGGTYFVTCDQSTTTSGDIERGIVNIVVGFTPVKPAEFVVLQIQQPAGQGSA